MFLNYFPIPACLFSIELAKISFSVRQFIQTNKISLCWYWHSSHFVSKGCLLRLVHHHDPRHWPETMMVDSKVTGEIDQKEHLPGKMNQDLVWAYSTIRGVSCSLSLRSQVREGDGKLVLVWSDVATGDWWALHRGIWGTQVSEWISGLL